jgi:hypothetical protein
MVISNLSSEMHNHYVCWQRSGLSQRSYCLENNLREGQFHYWIKKFRQLDSHANSVNSGFVPLLVTASNSINPIVEIQHKDGHCIRFFQSVDASVLKSLL